jgi:hypothetical protein
MYKNHIRNFHYKSLQLLIRVNHWLCLKRQTTDSYVLCEMPTVRLPQSCQYLRLIIYDNFLNLLVFEWVYLALVALPASIMPHNGERFFIPLLPLTEQHCWQYNWQVARCIWTSAETLYTRLQFWHNLYHIVYSQLPIPAISVYVYKLKLELPESVKFSDSATVYLPVEFLYFTSPGNHARSEYFSYFSLTDISVCGWDIS